MGYEGYFGLLELQGKRTFELPNFILNTSKNIDQPIVPKDNPKTRCMSEAGLEQLYIDELTRFYINNYGRIFARYD
jgi:hypothetical protein